MINFHIKNTCIETLKQAVKARQARTQDFGEGLNIILKNLVPLGGFLPPPPHWSLFVPIIEKNELVDLRNIAVSSQLI